MIDHTPPVTRMDFTTALATSTPSQSLHVHALLSSLTAREKNAILAESRLNHTHWRDILSNLMNLASHASPDDVRCAVSKALHATFLTGPQPMPAAEFAERAVSFERALTFLADAVDLPRIEMQDHFDSWSDPANPDALKSCTNLLGKQRTGPRPSWAVPFSKLTNRPLDGLSAADLHQRLALYPEVDTAPKLIMTYALPAGTAQAVPTIADAFQWNDAPPHWRYFFLPSPFAMGYGMTAPVDPALSGFPEIVHEPVDLSNLIAPLQVRN